MYKVYPVKIPWHAILFLQNSDEQCGVPNASSKLYGMLIIMTTAITNTTDLHQPHMRSKLLIKGRLGLLWVSLVRVLGNSLIVYN